jgi:hypothetical protein
MISAAAALASLLLLTAITLGANVARCPLGRRQPAGNCAATRSGIAGSPSGFAVVDDDAPVLGVEVPAHALSAADAARVANRKREEGARMERPVLGGWENENGVVCRGLRI